MINTQTWMVYTKWAMNTLTLIWLLIESGTCDWLTHKHRRSHIAFKQTRWALDCVQHVFESDIGVLYTCTPVWTWLFKCECRVCTCMYVCISSVRQPLFAYWIKWLHSRARSAYHNLNSCKSQLKATVPIQMFNTKYALHSFVSLILAPPFIHSMKSEIWRVNFLTNSFSKKNNIFVGVFDVVYIIEIVCGFYWLQLHQILFVVLCFELSLNNLCALWLHRVHVHIHFMLNIILNSTVLDVRIRLSFCGFRSQNSKAA